VHDELELEIGDGVEEALATAVGAIAREGVARDARSGSAGGFERREAAFQIAERGRVLLELFAFARGRGAP